MVSRIAFLFDTQNIKVGPVIFFPSPQIPRLLRPCIGTLLGGKFGVVIGELSVQGHQDQLGLPSFPGWYMRKVTLAFTKGLKKLLESTLFTGSAQSDCRPRSSSICASTFCTSQEGLLCYCKGQTHEKAMYVSPRL